MKRIFRIFAAETASIYLVSQIASGIVFQNGFISVLMTGLALTAATFLVKPVINLLLLPLNLLTFGLFRWLSHAITLFLVDVVLPDFAVVGFNFPGVDLNLFSIPAVATDQRTLSYIGFSLVLAFVTTIIYWLVD